MNQELIKLEQSIELRDADREEELSEIEEGNASRWLKFASKRNTFLLVVILPGILVAFYYGLVASAQYVAETRMIVRTIGISEKFDTSEKRDGRSVIGGDSLTQDSYIVADYLKSPGIVETLERKIGLRRIFSSNDIDFLSRLPEDASFERLHRYWNRQIDTYVDGPSGIIVFNVRAFSSESALMLLEEALVAADEMITKISIRAQRDLIARAEKEVSASLASYQQSLEDLRAYQNESGILDPTSTARLTTSVISKLVEEKLRIVAELDSFKAANAGNSVRAKLLAQAVDSLDRQIEEREDSLAGQAGDGAQLSENLKKFSQLETRHLIAKAIYEANARNLDTASSTALKRSTFISIFSAAHLPEESEYPARFSAWVIFTLGMFTLWVSGTLIWLSIQDHRV